MKKTIFLCTWLLITASVSAMENNQQLLNKTLLDSICVYQTTLETLVREHELFAERVRESDDVDDHQKLASVETNIEELKDNFREYLIEDIFKSSHCKKQLTTIIKSIQPSKNDANAHKTLDALLKLYLNPDTCSATQAEPSKQSSINHEDTLCSIL